MSVFYIIISLLCTIVAVAWIYPKILLVAIKKNVVDSPCDRKLQHKPIPVMGGVTVVFGILVGLGCSCLFINLSELLPIVIAILIMLYIGMIDDCIGLSPTIRFVVEIVVVLLLIYTYGYSLSDFHGLWGHNIISAYVAVPLTIFACVGIINAINLIDGINGYSSGYCIMACSIFGVFFYFAGDNIMVILATVSVGALLPFFFHNVFGIKSKMFIGDGGTLVMGFIMSVFVVYALRADSSCEIFINKGAGLISFTLAVMCVPIFDTIRVMSTRIIRGKSPFHPDKTHLHHLFIDMGFSHIGTTIFILTLNCFVILCWWIAYRCGVSIDGQFYIVIGFSVLITFVFYKFMRIQQSHNTWFYRTMRSLGRVSHFEQHGIFLWLQKMMDRSVHAECKEEANREHIEKGVLKIVTVSLKQQIPIIEQLHLHKLHPKYDSKKSNTKK
ncbi:MAG: MraY family glycosyltransferase [Muribaculaceae bacterium]